jgi:hypothetical protein
MSVDFSHLMRGLDVGEKEVAEAVVSRDSTRALLARLAAVSAPNTGAAKVLLVFARLATTACDWIDGDLLIEIVGDDEQTVIEALTELGGGLRERLFGPLSFRSPLYEFARAIDRVPHLVAPLAIQSATARRVTLAASAVVRRTSVPPPPTEIAPDSLFVRPPALAVPRSEPEGPSLPVVSVESVRPPPEQPIADVDQGWED